jgi:hypothetical protein
VLLGKVRVSREQLGHRQPGRLGSLALVRGSLQFEQQGGERGAGLVAVVGAREHPELSGAGRVGPDGASLSGLSVWQAGTGGYETAGKSGRTASGRIVFARRGLTRPQNRLRAPPTAAVLVRLTEVWAGLPDHIKLASRRWPG